MFAVRSRHNATERGPIVEEALNHPELNKQDLPETVACRAAVLFNEAHDVIHRRTDRLFAWLMPCQWLPAIAPARWITPRTRAGPSRQIHLHPAAARFPGAAITLVPVTLASFQP